ncbi:MAG: hypothetical protein QXJ94_05785 [Candidatus Bathyarchaeia archaeon]
MGQLLKQKKGQFVIIAILLIAIMIISTGALMHRFVTYYAHEPWEEYLTLISNIELNSRRVVELSLANYTQTGNDEILEQNLALWQLHLNQIYLDRQMNLQYDMPVAQGLTCDWNKSTSFSRAIVDFNLDIASIGLSGYKYNVTTLLKVKIINRAANELNVTITRENNMPITDLSEDNFKIEKPTGINITRVSYIYDDNNGFIYRIICSTSLTTPTTLLVCDNRGIIVRAIL